MDTSDKKRIRRAILWLGICCFIESCTSGAICQGPVCEFHFEIRRTRSMTYFEGRASYNVILDESLLQIAPNSLRLAHKTPLVGKTVSPDDVITLDGVPANIIVINEQFPGPTIEVMEGTEVVVHVTNLLKSEGLTIHWHGMYQKDSPWMDGTAYVSQCLVQPHQTFTYRFKADPAGTHWYHSHIAAQRMDGLFGLLLVHKRLPNMPYFPLAVQDWYQYDASSRAVLDPWSTEFQGTGETLLDSDFREYAPDSVQIGAIASYSGLINGRGRADPSRLFPLTTFTAQEGQRVLFRVVNVGGEYAWEISLDQHVLTVVASDGYDLQPIESEFFFVEPGETMDFEVTLDQSIGSYWLRAKTLRAGVGPYPMEIDGKQVEVKAIVHYEGADTTLEPSSSPVTCTQQSVPCRVFNCNFEDYAWRYNRRCIHIRDAKSAYTEDFLQHHFGINDEMVEEYFLNFAFPVGSSVNARRFREPSAPLYQKNALENYITKCDDRFCDENGCKCTHILEIPEDKTIQLVMSNLVPGQKISAHHPIHIHGTGFAVMKTGYPEMNYSTGHWSRPNQDVLCEKRLCAQASWRDGAPELNTDYPAVKDTVVVPARGYTVVRFRSTNPGFWFVHCHVEQHIIDGMNMIFDVAPNDHPPLPVDFPVCYNFTAQVSQLQRQI